MNVARSEAFQKGSQRNGSPETPDRRCQTINPPRYLPVQSSLSLRVGLEAGAIPAATISWESSFLGCRMQTRSFANLRTGEGLVALFSNSPLENPSLFCHQIVGFPVSPCLRCRGLTQLCPRGSSRGAAWSSRWRFSSNGFLCFARDLLERVICDNGGLGAEVFFRNGHSSRPIFLLKPPCDNRSRTWKAVTTGGVLPPTSPPLNYSRIE
jgi:hypothetical protein